MDTDSLVVCIKADHIYKDIAGVVETSFDTSMCKTFDTSIQELDRPLPKGKNKKVVGLMKVRLGRNIMTKVVGSKAKTYSYLKDDSS